MWTRAREPGFGTLSIPKRNPEVVAQEEVAEDALAAAVELLDLREKKRSLPNLSARDVNLPYQLAK